MKFDEYKRIQEGSDAKTQELIASLQEQNRGNHNIRYQQEKEQEAKTQALIDSLQAKDRYPPQSTSSPKD